MLIGTLTAPLLRRTWFAQIPNWGELILILIHLAFIGTMIWDAWGEDELERAIASRAAMVALFATVSGLMLVTIINIAGQDTSIWLSIPSALAVGAFGFYRIIKREAAFRP